MQCHSLDRLRLIDDASGATEALKLPLPPVVQFSVSAAAVAIMVARVAGGEESVFSVFSRISDASVPNTSERERPVAISYARLTYWTTLRSSQIFMGCSA